MIPTSDSSNERRDIWMKESEPFLGQSNNPLPSEEEIWVRDLIHDANKDLEIIDPKLMEVEAEEYRDLPKQRKNKIERIKMLKVSISALKKIPSEVIAEILLHCVANRRFKIYIPASKSGITHPWYLGQICSGWRRVMWGTPQFWNSFLISDWRGMKYRPTAQILKEILSRTTACFSATIDTFDVAPIFEVLGQFTPRVSTLYIRKADFSHLRYILGSNASLVSSLTSLTLRASDVDLSPIPIYHPPFSFAAASNLQCFTLGELYEHSIMGVFAHISLLPWEQLTTLTVKHTGGIPMLLAYQTLEKCASLVDCTLSGVVCTIETPTLQPITLSDLETFDFSFTEDEASVGHFFKLFVLPSLRMLTMSCKAFDEDGTHTWYEDLTSLILRSGCALKGLYIHLAGHWSWEPIDNEVQELMHSLSSLEEFSSHTLVPPSFFQAMQTQNLLPKLRSMGTCSVNPDGLHALLNLLDSYIDPEDPYTYNGSLTDVSVYPSRGLGYKAAIIRYETQEQIYTAAGISVVIEDYILSESGSEISSLSGESGWSD